MQEHPYEAPPASPSDWTDYVRSHPALHPQPPQVARRAYEYTSLDQRAIIDELAGFESFHHRRSRSGKDVSSTDTASLAIGCRRLQRLRSRPVSHTLQVETLANATNNRERFSRVKRIDECGIDDVLFRSEEGPRLYRTHCRCRACPRCDRARRRKLQSQFERRMSIMKRPKFLTLTLKQSNDELSVSVHRIKEAFRRMRACTVWKQLVKGGFWILEIKRNSESAAWNVHLHAIVDAAYLPQEWLSRTWLRHTGDSYVVDIRRAKPSITRYLSKYVTKGSDVDVDGMLLWQFYEAQHRMRDCSTFGNQFGFGAEAASETSILQYCGVVSDILNKARSGDVGSQELATQILEALNDTEIEPPDISTAFAEACTFEPSQN